MKLFFDDEKQNKPKKQKPSDKLEGIIEKVIYKNDENSYAVCLLTVADGSEHIIEGYMPMPEEGTSVSVYGKWVVNPKYGKQFKVEQYERVLPKETEDIIKYLSGGAIKGIGPVSAAKIVDKFGDSTFDVLENHPEWLADIPGISRKKAKAIGEEYREKSSMRDAMIFFRDYFGMTVIMRIIKKWGKDAIRVAHESPYILCDEIDGIGFEKADRLALNIGLEKESGERVRAGIVHCLDRNLNGNGHMCLPINKLAEETSSLIGVDFDSVISNIGIMLAAKTLIMYECGGEKYIYLKEAYRVERNVAKRLKRLNRVRPTTLSSEDVAGLIEKQELISGIEYASKQKKAIHEAMQNGITVMTGGPGTGKTTVVKALIAMFESIRLEVALCAPTGRAAMRLSESTSHTAKTVHRLLEMDFSDGESKGFQRNLSNPLNADVIIVDEASMIDCMLMNSLLAAIKNGARLIMIGDADQLPSVGGGNVLGDIIESGKFPVVRLDEIFRQAKESLIITNAHEINSGNMPVLDKKNGDFFFLETENENLAAETIAKLVKIRLPKAYSLSPITDIQVLSPTKKGILGTDNMNSLLREMLNPKTDFKAEYFHGNTLFREGDKVMQMKNNYDLAWFDVENNEDGNGIFNGDVGVIESIDKQDGFMTILFDKRRCEYDFSFLDDLSLAYTITVHKSQGSEYPIVVISLASAMRMLLTRNLLYTAVTRAKKIVVLVGSRQNIRTMVENNTHAKRFTCLEEMLSNSET